MIQYHLSEVVAALDAQHSGADVQFTGCSNDTRTLTAGALYIALRGEHFDGHDFIAQARDNGAVAVLSEADTDMLPCLKVDDTRMAMGKLAALWRSRFDLPVVAVTGSNGKTSVKEMLRAIFAQLGPTLATPGNLNNDIGLPRTLFEMNASHAYAVIEMGANHPGEIRYLTQIARPQVATITLCAPAHLEGFGSIEGVARAKGEIFESLPTDGTAVINADDVYADFWRELNTDRHCLTFGLEKTADVTASNMTFDGLQSRFTLHTPSGHAAVNLPLPGRHNIMNALTAAACALASGVAIETIAQGLENVESVKGRLQRHAGIKQSTILDDTYNANPTSLNAALEVLATCPAPCWLALGDMLELGECAESFHADAGAKAKSCGVERLFATGPLSKLAVTQFGEGGLHFEEQDDLIRTLQAELPAAATVLVKGSRGLRMERVVAALTQKEQ